MKSSVCTPWLPPNELNESYFVETALMMFNLIKEVKEKLDITISFVNFGGGIGIPYRPEQEPVNLEQLGEIFIKLTMKLSLKTDYHL